MPMLAFKFLESGIKITVQVQLADGTGIETFSKFSLVKCAILVCPTKLESLPVFTKFSITIRKNLESYEECLNLALCIAF